MHQQKPVIYTQFQYQLSSEATINSTQQTSSHRAQMKSGIIWLVPKALSYCQAF